MSSCSSSFLRTLLVSLACIHAVTCASTPVVNLGYAQYQGVVDTDRNITSFLGLRYAAPPTGNLRWRAPVPPSKTSGIQIAATNPPQCFQGPNGGQNLTNPFAVRDVDEQSEDCLFLSVYSPDLKPKALLPTIVWIHGGGYVLGNAESYDGADLVQESNNNVVSVVIQYRLGLFGFLAGKQVQADGSLNAGLLDQDFALRWVNKYIAQFGYVDQQTYCPILPAEMIESGDPDQVTIWGESAGAGSVLQHIIANDGKTNPPLFRAAITSSTFLPSQYPFNHRIPQRLFEVVAAQAGCGNATDLSCLRAVDSTTLETINVDTTSGGFQGTFTWVPVIDQVFITQSPTVALAQRKVNGEILLSVTNSNEGFIFVNQTVEYNVSEYAQQLFPLLGAEAGNAVAFAYRSFGSPLEQVTAIMSESIFVCPTYLLLSAFPEKSFKGEFAIPPAHHGDDGIYYFPDFPNWPGSPPFNSTAFVEAFVDGFLSFAVNLDPNAKLRPTITPRWSKYAPSVSEMVFNKTERGVPAVAFTPTSKALLQRCDLWRSLYNLTRQ